MPIPRIKNVRAAITPAYCNASARYVSSTFPHMATATSSTHPSDPRGGTPVEDIDLVFDYPSSAQGSMSKDSPSLESAGLGAGMYGGRYTGRGIDETMDAAKGTMNSMGSMRNTIKEEMKQNIKKPTKSLGKEMGFPDNNIIYMGLGALGLGALYMSVREPSVPEEAR